MLPSTLGVWCWRSFPFTIYRLDILDSISTMGCELLDDPFADDIALFKYHVCRLVTSLAHIGLPLDDFFQAQTPSTSTTPGIGSLRSQKAAHGRTNSLDVICPLTKLAGANTTSTVIYKPYHRRFVRQNVWIAFYVYDFAMQWLLQNNDFLCS